MKKTLKFGLVGLLFGSLIFASCRNITGENERETDNAVTKIAQEVIIGDEVIYGESFSLQSICDCIFEEIEETSRSIRGRSVVVNDEALELKDSDMIAMVYFSVEPKTVDGVRLVNEKMGYLNPLELDKDIIQTCDAEKLIFTNTDVSESDNIEEYVNFDTKYYYITQKSLQTNFPSY